MRKDSTPDEVLTPRVLREYALVADGERGALIGPDGSVAWLCAPRWDSPAAFSGLLGGVGRYTVTPAGRWHVWGGYYETGSLIWRSRWVSDWKTEWRAATVAADAIEQRWQEPDAGIWELGDQHWAHSRIACVSGLRAIATAAGSGGARGQREAARWSSLADAIAASLADCVHPSGRWQRAPDDERVDAALLHGIIRGGLGLSDPRNVATIEAVRNELAADGFVYRFRQDARPLHKAEGAFLLSGFWMALAEHAYGHPVAAAHWFERNRSAAGPAALYTEEYDVHQRQLRGNLPQAFVHAAMLECAVTLSRDVRLGFDG
jgi:GH15 family glucan-1,4-alpha-glucosidase